MLSDIDGINILPSLTIRTRAKARGDVIFVPSDSHGTPGTLNSEILEELGSPVRLPDEKDLVRGYCFRQWSQGVICFIVTVGLLPTREALGTFLSEAFRAPELKGARKIWLPLMGTGAGRLPPALSFEITLNALNNSGWLDKSDRHATISLPDNVGQRAATELRSVIMAASERSVHSLLANKPPSSDFAWKTNLSPAVVEVLDLAARLSKMRRSSSKLSTSLMFFALVESQGAAASETLATDGCAAIFASMVLDLADEQYEKAWLRYFGTDKYLRARESVTIRPEFTENVRKILEIANISANNEGSATVNTDHLIRSLIEYEKMGARSILDQLKIHPRQILKAYADAQIGWITMKFSNDIASDIDRLGYDRYATAIVDFLTHAETPPPISISIQAPWGGGKSSLMRLVREKLDPTDVRERHKQKVNPPSKSNHLKLGAVIKILDRKEKIAITPDKKCSKVWTIWFNAWKYETSEQIWAGLVDAIVSQVADRLPLLEREKFLLKLHLARIDDGIVRKRIYDRVINIWWSKVRAWSLAGLGAFVILIGLRTASTEMPDAFAKSIGLWAGHSAIAVPVIMSIYLIGTYFLNRSKIRDEPANYSLADYIRVPSYDKSTGEIHQIHDDLRRVLNVVPRTEGTGDHAPIVIFIDDLDRCSPSKVAGVVEGVSMLLASDTYRCMFVIGMDPQMVAAALEKAHEDVRKRLPRYERSIPLGWRFMDKFIQIPFTIPPAPAAQFGTYLDWLSGSPSDASSNEIQKAPNRSLERCAIGLQRPSW